MFVTTHVIAGGALGALTRRWWLAVPVGVASHLVLDAVPHWGPPSERVFLLAAVVDGLVGLVVLAWVTRRLLALGGAVGAAGVAGMLGGALPDLDKPARVLLSVDLWPEWFDRVHGGVQWESPSFLGLEAAYALLAALALATVLPRRSRETDERPTEEPTTPSR